MGVPRSTPDRFSGVGHGHAPKRRAGIRQLSSQRSGKRYSPSGQAEPLPVRNPWVRDRAHTGERSRRPGGGHLGVIMVKRVMVATAFALALAACGESNTRSTRHLVPIPPRTLALMAEKGMSSSDPILVRAYKTESELEVWKRRADGNYAHLKTYPICRWSGQLGPKIREGDRQAPEGFYMVTPGQMNPDSANYLAFDTGFPNEYDRAHGRTGAYLMVHG